MRFTSAPSYRIILFAIHASTYDIKGDVLAEDSHHNWKDDLAREPTAEEYLQHGEPLPAIAASVTTVRDEQSYIVKIDCSKCPSRVRTGWQGDDMTWDVVEQETSFLYNIKTDDHENALLINGNIFFPSILRSMETIDAFQTPRNLSKELVETMVDMNMLVMSMRPFLEAKYPAYHLYYDRRVGKNNTKHKITLITTAIEDIDGRYPAKKAIPFWDQKVIQLGIEKENGGEIRIKDIEVLNSGPQSPRLAIGLFNYV